MKQAKGIRAGLFGLTIATMALTAPLTQAAEQCEDTPLGETMEEMKTSFKSLRGAAKSGDWDSIAPARAKISELAATAADEEPMKLQDIDESERPQMLEDYRAGINRLQELLDELAAAEQARDLDGMRELVAQLGQHSKDSHKQFKKDCDD
ncbi:hypothetical protein GCM10011348_38450 [Marinobacterium nitratireducens]|uniref:Cytochrome b562 n=1 Tax=Marinobacterium nitratireducens TaxID=518897 RepID=A0A917ZMQ0_9GAMM|nr:cytochrome b562 [Marinobacterium nitratireducens]GGO86776.1 hypothetical protein GCM10011348_38450 [Marinobacterium nitratireducens]